MPGIGAFLVKRLRNIKIVEGSVVPKGANQHAHILIVKSSTPFDAATSYEDACKLLTELVAQSPNEAASLVLSFGDFLSRAPFAGVDAPAVEAAATAVVSASEASSMADDLAKTLAANAPTKPAQDGPAEHTKGSTVKTLDEVLAALSPEDAQVVRDALAALAAQKQPEIEVEAEAKPEEKPEVAAAKAELAKALAAKDERVIALEKQLADAQKAAIRKDAVAKASAFVVPGLSTDEVADLLLNETVAPVVTKAFAAVTEAVKTSNLFKAAGTNAPTTVDKDDPNARLAAKVADLRKANPKLTLAQAESAALADRELFRALAVKE